MKLKPFEVDQMIEALFGQFKDELTPWESDFVGSIQMQWARKHHLTDGQERKLNEVWEEFATGRRRRAAG